MAGNTQHISGVSSNRSQVAVGTFHAPVYFGNNENHNDVLNSLPIAKDAAFNAYQRQDNPTCLPETRVDLLQDIYNWADGENSPKIFWLSGLAGTGKSTVARTVTAKYSREKALGSQDSRKCALGASFFFSKGGGDVSHAGKFVTSIAVQLMDNVASLKQTISAVVTEQSDIVNQPLREQWQRLILGPLSKLEGSSSQTRYILIVDALDECEDENSIWTILQLFAETRTLVMDQLRVLLTSRPEFLIRRGFLRILDAEHRDLELHKISTSIVNHDIGVYLRQELKFIAQERSLPTSWPGDPIISRLVQDADGLFIWAATACRFIDEGSSAKERLNILLGSVNPAAQQKIMTKESS